MTRLSTPAKERIESGTEPAIPESLSRTLNGLLESHLFASVPLPEVRKLAARARRFSMNPGPLFLEGDISSHAYVLVAGRIDISVFSTDGRELLLYRAGPGDFFGETGLLGRDSRSASAIARIPCEIISISRETLLEFLTHNPDAALHMIVSLSQRLRTADQTIKAITFLDMTARLARVLLAMEAEQGTRGVVHVSHEELASTLGCLRQSVTRTIAVWRRMGYVKTSRGQIAILNRRKLRAYVQE